MIKKLYSKRLWAGIGISAFFIYLLSRQVNLDDLRQGVNAFRDMRLIYLIPAVALTLLSYYARAVRWKFLLAPLKPSTRLSNLFPATVIGYMANNILPARLGEVVRAYVLGHREGLDKRSVFGTLVVDRLLDGFTVLLMLVVLLFALNLPPAKAELEKALTTGGYITLGFYMGVVALLIALKKNWSRTINTLDKALSRLSPKIAEKLVSLGGAFFSGIGLSGGIKHLISLFVSSIIIWALATWPIDLVLRSFGISLPMTGSMLIMVFLVFAVMIPAPGHIGLYEWACYQGLSAFDVPAGTALSISFVLRCVGFFPVLFLGGYYIWRDKISLRSITKKTDGGV